MILCLIILIVGIVLTAVGSVVIYKNRGGWNTPFWSTVVAAFGAAGILGSTLLLIIIPIESNQELNTFLQQKEYIESYEPTSEYDAAAILNKKIELNQWLYETQYSKERYPICSFYGDEILELEPIK